MKISRVPVLAAALLAVTLTASSQVAVSPAAGHDPAASTAVGTLPAAGRQAEWRVATEDYAWSFPRDHWAHAGYRIEWWYFTGHLVAEEAPGQRFGYQFTVFRIGLLSEPPTLDSAWSAGNLLMGHAALTAGTDETSGAHRFSELLYREAPVLAGFGSEPDPLIARSRAPAGTDDEWTLRWNGEAFDLHMRDDRRGIAFDLVTLPAKPLILQGPNGYSRKSDAAGAASLYYSFTRLSTTGSVTLDGRTWRVTGTSWMDKEFSSSQLGAGQVGWDWFSLQLDDGRELMLYEMRNSEGSVDHARGTLVGTDGRAAYLPGDAWTTRALGTWRSPESGITYPSGWEVRLPAEGLSLVLEPTLKDQENRSSLANAPSYWEGAVTVRDGSGAAIGRGFVELTGYGEGNRPPV